MTLSAKEAYDAQSSWINRGRGTHNEFIDEFLKDHNTLQQQVVSLWLQAMYAWVELVENGGWRVDARNEASYAKAKAIVDLLGDGGWRVPFI